MTNELPTTAVSLGQLLEYQMLRTEDLGQVDPETISAVSEWVAHHGCRYSAAHRDSLDLCNTGKSAGDLYRKSRFRTVAMRRLKRQVQRSMDDAASNTEQHLPPVRSALLSGLIGLAIRLFLQWLLSDYLNQAAAQAIGEDLPEWSPKDDFDNSMEEGE